jgi:hypothetical protein
MDEKLFLELEDAAAGSTRKISEITEKEIKAI